MLRKLFKNHTFFGFLASIILLIFYFTILTLVSGWSFAENQFFTFWYFIISLAFGFGIQIGLYTYLKQVIHQQNSSGKIVVVSGTTSTFAMISCCSHYLANILPIIGITGFIALVSQYQIQLFWVGLAANLVGILYMIRKIIKVQKGK